MLHHQASEGRLHHHVETVATHVLYAKVALVKRIQTATYDQLHKSIIGNTATNDPFVRSAVIRSFKMLREGRTAGLVKLHCSVEYGDQGRPWAVLARKRELLSVHSALPLMAA
jgi:HEAT repeat protein